MRVRERHNAAFERLDILGEVAALLNRLRDERFDQRENIFDAMVQLFVEDLLAHFRSMAFSLQNLRVPQHDFEQRVADGFGHIAIIFAPRDRLASNFLLPQREALARCETIAKRAALILLLGRARPIDGLRHFLAEDDEIVLRNLRQRDRERASGVAAVLLSARQMFGQFI